MTIKNKVMLVYAGITTCFLLHGARASNTEQDIWKEDAVSAYRTYLGYANGGLPSTESLKDLDGTGSYPLTVVTACDEPYVSLKSIVGHPTYGSKITFCGFKTSKASDCVNVHFHFGDTIIPRVFGCSRALGLIGETTRVAYRNIVPAEFELSSTLAGPMGCHEYMIDGSHYSCDGDKRPYRSHIDFMANSDPNKTPLQIKIIDCVGTWVVKGLPEKNTVFINESPELVIKYQ